MTLIELASFLFFFGGGALAGSGVTSIFAPKYSLLGGVAGVLLSLGSIFMIGQLDKRLNRKHAPCKCGKNSQEDFKFAVDPDWDCVTTCSCGLRYLMRKGWLWYEMPPDGNAILYMQRNFWGRWMPANAKNKAKRVVRRTGGIRSIQQTPNAPADLK